MIWIRALLGAAAAAVALSMAACGEDDPPAAASGSGNPAGVGNACTKNEDCATKSCYLGPGGGYCTTTCADEGSTSQCPVDTVCKPIQGGARRCLLICGSTTSCPQGGCPKEYCPRGSSCTSVGNTSAKACEPEPG